MIKNNFIYVNIDKDGKCSFYYDAVSHERAKQCYVIDKNKIVNDHILYCKKQIKINEKYLKSEEEQKMIEKFIDCIGIYETGAEPFPEFKYDREVPRRYKRSCLIIDKQFVIDYTKHCKDQALICEKYLKSCEEIK
jgi:hypothetical protein